MQVEQLAAKRRLPRDLGHHEAYGQQREDESGHTPVEADGERVVRLRPRTGGL